MEEIWRTLRKNRPNWRALEDMEGIVDTMQNYYSVTEFITKWGRYTR